jgi:DNA polymerase III alpha subunit
LLQVIGGVPDADTEYLRKAISKKKIDVFGEYKEQFLTRGAEQLERDCDVDLPDDANKVVEKLTNESSPEELEGKIADHAFYSLKENPYGKAMGYLAAFYKKQFPKRLRKEVLCAEAAKANARFMWDQIEAFSAYGFNKAHTYAYTYISSRLLWLKAHYPLEFYTGILSREKDEKKIQEYRTEAMIHGIKVQRLDINNSGVTFSIHQVGNTPSSADKIYFGLSNIKGIGKEVAQKIVDGQPYASFEDFLVRFGTLADVVKPLLALGLFKDADPITLYKFFESYKIARKSITDRQKRFPKAMAKYDEQLNELLKEHIELATWDEKNLEKWEELFNVDEIEEYLCLKPGPNYKQMMQRKFNRWKKLKALWGRRQRSMEDHEFKNNRVEENPFTMEKFDAELSDVEVPAEMLTFFENKEEAESKFIGFRWDHPLQKCPDFTGKTFAGLRATLDEQISHSGSLPVEVVLVECKTKEWKNKKGFNYVPLVEDANGEKQKITVWPDDWDRFKDCLLAGTLLRVRVLPPTKFGYTLDGVPKYKRHTLPPPERDFRIVKLRRTQDDRLSD